VDIEGSTREVGREGGRRSDGLVVEDPNKSRLTQVDLSSYELHLLLRELLAVLQQAHGRWIAGEGLLCEGVDEEQRQGHHLALEN